MSNHVAFARVSDQSLSLDECVAAVSADDAGAIVTFAGVVRDHDAGRSVSSLEYEAHPSADQALASVAAAISMEFPTVRIAIAHRVGSLMVGDLALAAAVASAHRSDAFAACSRLIDEVKLRVPIWKNQQFTDGTSEWVGSLG
jgi:molybdopterin synthase catalytic subunit